MIWWGIFAPFHVAQRDSPFFKILFISHDFYRSHTAQCSGNYMVHHVVLYMVWWTNGQEVMGSKYNHLALILELTFLYSRL